MRKPTAKHTIKDSVFTSLFRIPEYTFALYRSLHPEDHVTTKEDITVVTLENIFINQLYNDLGFTVGNRLLIFVEAQSTWTTNILVRMLLYAAQTIQKQIIDTKQNVYGSKKITFFKPEFYVLYTGDREEKPELLSLTEEFFEGQEADLELKIHVLYDGAEGDIIHQYVIFTQVYQEQVKLHGYTQEAVLETIRICKDKNILKAYLASHEKEVIDIMMTLFDYDTIFDIYLYNEKKEAEEKGEARGKAIGEAKGQRNMLFSLVQDGILSPEIAAARSNLTEAAFLEQMQAYYRSEPPVQPRT